MFTSAGHQVSLYGHSVKQSHLLVFRCLPIDSKIFTCLPTDGEILTCLPVDSEIFACLPIGGEILVHSCFHASCCVCVDT